MSILNALAHTRTGRPSGAFRLWLCVALTLGFAPVSSAAQAPPAEQWFRRGTVMLTVLAGGVAFTDFQRATVRATMADMQPSEFQRRVGARTTASIGGWMALWLSDAWGIRAGASYAPSSFAVRNEPSAQRALDDRADAPGAPADYAGLGVLHADVSILFRFPISLGRLVPYGLAGGGIVRYWRSGAGELPPEARDRFSRGAWSGAAGVVGVGTAIALQKGDLMLIFELTDHISRTPLDDAGAGEWFEVSGVRLQLEPDDTRVDTDGVGMTNSVRLLVGLSLPIR